MIFALSMLALAAFLGGVAIGVLLMTALGIRKGDLSTKPATHAEALAHHVLGVGIRSADHDEDERG